MACVSDSRRIICLPNMLPRQRPLKNGLMIVCVVAFTYITFYATFQGNLTKLAFEADYSSSTPVWSVNASTLHLDEVLRRIPKFVDVVPDCAAVDASAEALIRARAWKFDEPKFRRENLANKTDKCAQLRTVFAFNDRPFSAEECDYPLAYGLLVYKSVVQLYFLLSAIYHPQNAYCIAVDGNAASGFVEDVELFGECFPNIYVLHVRDVRWGEFSVVRGVVSCLRYLSALNHEWKYYQYLSGFDLPLKTNLEMVRIFKQLNGTVNAEVALAQRSRIARIREKAPLPLWKSSLSALLPRATVDAMFASATVRRLFEYLKGARVPDEFLWATIAGNIGVLPLPGAFNASAMYAAHTKQAHLFKTRRANVSAAAATSDAEPFALDNYYISRYQLWQGSSVCYGQYVKTSCAYGVRDVGAMLARADLVAHKFYFDVEPAAFFCVYETLRRRAYNARSQHSFRGDVYARLPHVRAAAGADPAHLNYFDKISQN